MTTPLATTKLIPSDHWETMNIHKPWFCVLIACIFSVSTIPAMAANNLVWCLSSSISDNGPNDWQAVPRELIHVVGPTRQAQAKEKLLHASFAKLSYNDAASYLDDGRTLSKDKIFYLVRASAYYLGDGYKLPLDGLDRIPFEAAFSPSREMILISNYALGDTSTPPPGNLALIIESTTSIKYARAECSKTR